MPDQIDKYMRAIDAIHSTVSQWPTVEDLPEEWQERSIIKEIQMKVSDVYAGLLTAQEAVQAIRRYLLEVEPKFLDYLSKRPASYNDDEVIQSALLNDIRFTSVMVCPRTLNGLFVDVRKPETDIEALRAKLLDGKQQISLRPGDRVVTVFTSNQVASRRLPPGQPGYFPVADIMGWSLGDSELGLIDIQFSKYGVTVSEPWWVKQALPATDGQERWSKSCYAPLMHHWFLRLSIGAC